MICAKVMAAAFLVPSQGRIEGKTASPYFSDLIKVKLSFSILQLY